jgi:acetolactate synthase-1/2/3 large subunit
VAQLGHELVHAFHVASSGRPGPVHLSLPFDVLEETLNPASVAIPTAQDFVLPRTILDVNAAADICDHLLAAQRPLILAGPALLRSGDLLAELADTSGVPVIGMESPRGVNDPALGSFAGMLAQADLIMLLGKPLDFTLRFGSFPTIASDCRFIHIDSDTRSIERTRNTLGDPQWLSATATADMLPAVQQLLEQFAGDRHPAADWYQQVYDALNYRPPQWQTLQSPPHSPLHPVEICWPLQQLLERAQQPILIADGGEFGQWAQACLRAPRRLINGPAGAIGSALPMALAARIACPQATIVTVMGDGTFGFHMAEFDTAVRYRLPFVSVLGNDACWNAEYQIQLRTYGQERLIGCELLPTRYDQVVTALGGYGEYVGDPAQMQPALERAFASAQPACVNVSMQRHAAPALN